MLFNKVLEYLAHKTHTKQADLARKANVSRNAVSLSFAAKGLSVTTLLRYLNLMGYDLYAVPQSIDLERLIQDSIKLESDNTNDN